MAIDLHQLAQSITDALEQLEAEENLTPAQLEEKTNVEAALNSVLATVENFCGNPSFIITVD